MGEFYRRDYERYQRRVDLGASLLDEHQPSWFYQINSDSLDMASTKDDVLGMLYGRFELGLIEVCKMLEPEQRIRLADYGFFLPESEQQIVTDGGQLEVRRRFRALTKAWREVVEWRHYQAQARRRQAMEVDK